MHIVHYSTYTQKTLCTFKIPVLRKPITLFFHYEMTKRRKAMRVSNHSVGEEGFEQLATFQSSSLYETSHQKVFNPILGFTCGIL